MANYVLEILDGDRAGEVLTVADRAVRIGRKPGNDLVLADEKTSGVHAEIVPEGDRHVLRDLGSTNGTFLDGKRITELVLTPGDVVTIGRLRVKFRRDDEAAGAVDAGELAVRRLDAGRVQRRGGSAGLIALAGLLAVGIGGWFWWQGRAGAADGEAGPQQAVAPLQVAGNRLAPELAGCESETGWQLRGAGLGFQTGGRAHSGKGGFMAQRGDATDGADFALVQLQEPIAVFAGRTLTLAAHARCEDGGQVALRALAFAANEQVPFRFRTGTEFAAVDGWRRLETTIGIPVGCDRLQLELVALLPSPSAAVYVDDVAVIDGGGEAPMEAKLPETNQTALATGAAFAVRSVDAEAPAILLGILPDEVPKEMAALHQAELGALSDVGGKLTCTPFERGFQLVVTGAAAVQLVFPADAAGGLLVDGGEGFRAAAAESEFPARAVLLGDRLLRAMVQLEQPATCRGQLGAGRYRLRVPTARLQLVLGFRAERQQADELVRQARRAQQEGRPGEALAKLQQQLQTVPMDSEALAQALALRSELQTAQTDRLRALQQDLDEALFFDTRGGFERVVLGVDALVESFGSANLDHEAGAACKRLRDAAGTRLAELDRAEREQQRTRLVDLANAFTAADQGGLGQLVQQYIDRHLAAGAPAGTNPPSDGK
jgi:hypothetical protein